MFKIFVNGEAVETEAQNITELLKHMAFDFASVAVALDGNFLPKTRYSETEIHSGQKVEVLSPMQGG
jgi:sulfur carrier protein